MSDGKRMETFIIGHIERRPLMRATDVYKLLYQGVFGVGHILGGDAYDRLLNEARNLNLVDQPDEPLLEDASVDGSMVRVNLRPYLRRGLPLDKIFNTMKATEPLEDAGEFLRLWGAFKHLVKSGRLNFSGEEIEMLDGGLRGGGCPPRHHSEEYRRAYSPSYRVALRRELERILGPEALNR